MALLGFTSFDRAQAVTINTNHYILQRTENGDLFRLGKYEEESSDSDHEDHTLIGLNEDEDDEETPSTENLVQKDHSSEVYYAGSSGVRPDGSEYVRVIPDQYGDETGNNFMRYVLTEYALEEKDSKGNPTGIFKLNKKETGNLSRDIIAKVKDLHGEKAEEYMNQYFGRTWEHFDVNETGFLDKTDMSGFSKYLLSD